MKEADKIELRSEEVQDIIGTPPNHIVRIGLTVIFIIILFVFTGSFFFKYPDIIIARVSVKGDNPPAEIKARINGKITELFVVDKQKVNKEQIIAVIENTCNYNDLLKLKNEIDSFETQIPDIEQFVISYKFENKYRLGELQIHYSKLMRQLKEYVDFIELDYHDKKIKVYNKQINALVKHKSNLKRQVTLSRKDFDLSKKQLKRDSVLYIKEFLSVTDYEKSKSKIIQKNNVYESFKSSLSDTEIRIVELEQSSLETKLQKINGKREFETTITETVDNLKAHIKKWEQDYLLKSPINGTITFINFQNINQNVLIGETVFTIVPGHVSKLIGYAEIPLSGSGKVKIGHQANVKFDDFPYTEFGMVRAEVEAISLVQSNEYYIAKLNFPDSLTTNYDKLLHFKQNMKGDAEIITEELPLAARIINPIKSLFYEKF